MRHLLALLLLLLPAWAGAQGISGTVRDSLTQKPLPFASVFLANTTLGATTNEQGQFALTRVPAGRYDLVASYVGYRLARRSVQVAAAMPPIALVLAPETNQLSEVVVRARRHANRPEDYRRFAELFLGTSSFSQQCRITNPREVLVEYHPQAKELAAEAPDFLEVENQALGYRIKYYGLRFRVSFVQQVLSFYGQPVFEELVPRNVHQRRRWESNRLTAYQGSQRHFLKSVYDDRVVAEGFLAQKLRIVPNPAFARADSLSAQLRHHRPPDVRTAAEQDSLASWGRVLPNLQLLYTAPRPIDSLRRVAADGRVFLRFTNFLRISYLRELPDPRYLASLGGPAARRPGAATGNQPQVSRLRLLEPEAELLPTGRLLSPLALFTEDYWGFEKMGEFLPLDYLPPPFFHP
ncbi:MAG: carboxypeptidase-like regulatory domain-containing protein [Janthinobacterium lividum]